MTTQTSLTRQAAWLMAAKFATFALAVLAPLLIVRRLNPFEYGLYKESFQVIISAVSMLPLGFGMSTYYFLPRNLKNQPAVVFNVVLIHLLLGLVAWIALAADPQLLVLVFKQPELAAYAPWIGGIILFSILGAFLDVVTVANQEIRVASLCLIGAQLSRTLLLFFAALWFGTVRSLIVAALLQAVLQSAYLFGYLSSRFPGFWKRLDWCLLRSQITYAVPLGFVGLLYSFQSDLHNYFVSRRFGADLFAVYSVGCFQLPLIGILGEAASNVMIVRVSQLQSRNDTREIIEVTARAARKLAAVFFPAYGFLMVVARELIIVLFTSRYLASQPIFMINLTILPTAVLFVDPVIRAFPGHLPFLVKFRSVVFGVLALALWIATNRFGMLGAITVTVGVMLVERTITMIYFARVLGFRRPDLAHFRDLPKLAVASAVAAVITALVRGALQGMAPLSLLVVCGLVYTIAYFLAVLILRIASPEERRMVLQSLASVRPTSVDGP